MSLHATEVQVHRLDVQKVMANSLQQSCDPWNPWVRQFPTRCATKSPIPCLQRPTNKLFTSSQNIFTSLSKLWKANISFVISLRPSACNNSAPAGRI